MNEENSPNTEDINALTAGWASWRWLSGAACKERQWLLGIIRNRRKYESWMVYLSKGLQEQNFLLRYETTTDPWERSKQVGQRISELRKAYRAMTPEQRAELAAQAEVELRAGLELVAKDKQMILNLITLADPPAST